MSARPNRQVELLVAELDYRRARLELIGKLVTLATSVVSLLAACAGVVAALVLLILGG